MEAETLSEAVALVALLRAATVAVLWLKKPVESATLNAAVALFAEEIRFLSEVLSEAVVLLALLKAAALAVL